MRRFMRDTITIFDASARGAYEPRTPALLR